MNILVVDDKPENLYLLESLLKGSGYDVVSAKNGAEALEKLKTIPIDMIISDILMPVMDGFQLCHKVKEDEVLQKIPFIIRTSSYNEKKDEELALKWGADKYVVAPIEPAEFMKIIDGLAKEKKEGKIFKKASAVEKEEEIYKLYSERLVKKLEQKLEELNNEIAERKQAEEKLKDNLAELQEIAKAATGREIKMIDLEKEVNALLKELGREPKYKP